MEDYGAIIHFFPVGKDKKHKDRVKVAVRTYWLSVMIVLHFDHYSMKVLANWRKVQ